MRFRKWLSIPTVAMLLSSGSAFAKHQAKLSLGEARAIALAKVSGKVVHEELEKEKGRWIYSFEIRPTGETRKLVKEVNLDADTGAVVAIDTERE